MSKVLPNIFALACLACLAWVFPKEVRGACLPDAIPEAQRRHLAEQDGTPYPVGVWIGEWASGYITASIIRIIIEERMGYHASYSGSPAVADALYALAGCSQPKNESDRGCGPSPTLHHLAVEYWADTYRTEYLQLQLERPTLAPVEIDFMGYIGQVGHFIRRETQEQALNEDGVALEFYRGWNASWYQPSKYFDSLASIDRNQVDLCSNSLLMMTSRMEDYLRVTGDEAGVERLPNGNLVAMCPDGHFWLAPKCRAANSTCVPYLTGGSGWRMDEVMVKATSFYMPLALGSAKVYEVLLRQTNSVFFWWTPDVTFVDMLPVAVAFPDFDFNAWHAGDKRTSPASNRLSKLVSQDLSDLAPDIVELVESMRLSIQDVNDMLQQVQAGDSYEAVACRWLQQNPGSWESWAPDKSRCFAGFGLYSAGSMDFVLDRNNSVLLECKPCRSGSYSSRLDDASGTTHVCLPCQPGTSQPSGAAEICEPCPLGEFQNNSGTDSCVRCPIGEYQNQKGSSSCVRCPARSSTLGLGSRSYADCGCLPGYIDVGPSSLSCAECSEGLDCPALSKLSDLLAGSTALGEDFLPQIMPGCYSTRQKPLEVFRCKDADRCPGGPPGTCTDTLGSVACTTCPDGHFWTGAHSQQCSAWMRAAWVLGILLAFMLLSLAYYAMARMSSRTNKATPANATTSAFSITASMVQTLGVVSMMTVKVPAQLQGIVGLREIVVLNLENLALGCLIGNEPFVHYLLSASFFPSAVCWLALCHFVSKILPLKFRWTTHITKNMAGKVLQTGFETMSAISLVPLTCYRHPNGTYSVLQYPGVFCGSGGHAAMLAVGVLLLLVGVVGFISVCIYIVNAAPRWAARNEQHRLDSAQFLVDQFRLESSWYQVPMLLRGPLLSLTIVLTTDHPPSQVISLTMTLAAFVTLVSWARPWKLPLLNMADGLLSLSMLMLVAASALHLDVLDVSMRDFVDTVSVVMWASLGMTMILLLLATASGLCYRALGGQREVCCFNLQTLPLSQPLAAELRAIALELAQMDQETMCNSIACLAVYDFRLLMKCMSLLATEVVPDAESRVSQRKTCAAHLGEIAELSEKEIAEPSKAEGSSQDQSLAKFESEDDQMTQTYF